MIKCCFDAGDDQKMNFILHTRIIFFLIRESRRIPAHLTTDSVPHCLQYSMKPF